MPCREGSVDPEMRSAKRTTLCRALQSWFVALLYHTDYTEYITLLTQEKCPGLHLFEGLFPIHALPVDPPPNIIMEHAGKNVPCDTFCVMAPNSCQGGNLKCNKNVVNF